MKMAAVGTLAALLAASCTSGQQQNAQSQAKDVYLVAAVKAKLATIDVDSASAVHATARDGAVTLTGAARTDAERAQYAQATRSVDGVVSVADHMTVNPHLRGVREQTDDAALTAKVTAALAGQTGVNALHIAVDAHRGTVTLTGTVPTRAIADTALSTARGVSGVKAVQDRLTITNAR